MNLREATGFLLRANDVGTQLKLVDNYIQTYNRMPGAFVLPAVHAHLKAVVEAFATDTSAFSDYIRALRDASDSVQYDELHKLYRTVSIRALQNERRTRIRKAVMLLEPVVSTLLQREISYDEQMEVGKWLEQIWGQMRLDLMAEQRNELRAKRLNTEDRAVLLDAFWKNIDNKLESGTVPLADRAVDEIIERLRK